MVQCSFKQRFFTKASFESKSKWANGQEIRYKKYGIICNFSCSLCKFRKWEIKDKILKHYYDRKNASFTSRNIRKSLILGSQRHLIDKAASTTSFRSEDSFPSVSLSAEKVKLFMNDSDSKGN